MADLAANDQLDHGADPEAGHVNNGLLDAEDDGEENDGLQDVQLGDGIWIADDPLGVGALGAVDGNVAVAVDEAEIAEYAEEAFASGYCLLRKNDAQNLANFSITSDDDEESSVKQEESPATLEAEQEEKK